MDDGTSNSEPGSTELSDIAGTIAAAWERERPDIPVGSIGVITRIWQAGKLLEADRRATMLRLGMDVPTRDLLSTLRRAGPPFRLSAGELARHALVSPGAVSQRVARAERDGYVRRIRSETDGRGVLVELTESGRELIEHTVADLLRHEEDLLSGLGADKRDQLAGLLRELLAELHQRVELD